MDSDWPVFSLLHHERMCFVIDYDEGNNSVIIIIVNVTMLHVKALTVFFYLLTYSTSSYTKQRSTRL